MLNGYLQVLIGYNVNVNIWVFFDASLPAFEVFKHTVVVQQTFGKSGRGHKRRIKSVTPFFGAFIFVQKHMEINKTMIIKIKKRDAASNRLHNLLPDVSRGISSGHDPFGVTVRCSGLQRFLGAWINSLI